MDPTPHGPTANKFAEDCNKGGIDHGPPVGYAAIVYDPTRRCRAMDGPLDSLLTRASGALASADALVIAAGAGMGVDSGLPDFRGPEGFWKAYPPYAKLGLSFVELADPSWFANDPGLAWGFYGHRRNLYRATTPHPGFAILKRWAERSPGGWFAFTSNVDGHFQRAGFDEGRIVEVHGALDWCQCTGGCGVGIYPAGPEEVAIDEATCRASGDLPSCPRCGALARPNVLMFGDWDWLPDRTSRQEKQMGSWLSGLDGARLVVVECGAGGAVPTVRRFSQRLVATVGGVLLRINPREPEVPSGHIGIPLGALEVLRELDRRLAPA
jgi:NAD-dependent SIR2 family protein deacetylase